MPLRPDLFHLLRESHVVSQRLERAAYAAIQTADRARRAVQEAAAPKRRRGKPLKITVPLAKAQAQEEASIDTYELWRWLLAEVRQSLEPITPSAQLAAVEQARETLHVAIAHMLELQHKEISAYAQTLQKHLAELLAPLEWLASQLAPWRTELAPKDEAFLLWLWRHRQHLDLPIEPDIPPRLQPVAQAFFSALTLFHRASSLAESLHSWLRPHLQSHRGMPQWLLPLLQLVWNHHTFQRGKRAGQSPLQLAGVSDAPSLAEALDRLFTNDPDPAVTSYSLAC